MFQYTLRTQINMYEGNIVLIKIPYKVNRSDLLKREDIVK